MRCALLGGGQIDIEQREWKRPAAVMKGGDAHTVTLNLLALELLADLKGEAKPKATDLVFPGQRGKPLSDMTMAKVLRAAEQPYDAHGFRRSFRDWAAEKMPLIPDPVAEAALAHAAPDKVVRAYKRTAFVDMRRELLEGWSAFLSSTAPSQERVVE